MFKTYNNLNTWGGKWYFRKKRKCFCCCPYYYSYLLNYSMEQSPSWETKPLQL